MATHRIGALTGSDEVHADHHRYLRGPASAAEGRDVVADVRWGKHLWQDHAADGDLVQQLAIVGPEPQRPFEPDDHQLRDL